MSAVAPALIFDCPSVFLRSQQTLGIQENELPSSEHELTSTVYLEEATG